MPPVTAASAAMSSNLSDDPIFVSLAYILAFLPWAIISVHDFIDSEWRSLHSVWKFGLVHLVLSALPVLYMPVYVLFQGREGDFKEMWTGMILWVFALFHHIRTWWGLWQLQYFQVWSTMVLTRLEEMGYRLSAEDAGGNEVEQKGDGPKSREKKDNDDTRKARILSALRNMRLKNTIVDNELLKKDAPCRFNWSRLSAHASALFRFRTVKSKHQAALQEAWILPRKPGLCIARWTAAVLFQYGRKWVEHCHVRVTPEGVVSWRERRDDFAMRVLATASLSATYEVNGSPTQDRSSSIQLTSRLPPAESIGISRGGVYSTVTALQTVQQRGHTLPFGIQWGILRPHARAPSSVPDTRHRDHKNDRSTQPPGLEDFMDNLPPAVVKEVLSDVVDIETHDKIPELSTAHLKQFLIALDHNVVHPMDVIGDESRLLAAKEMDEGADEVGVDMLAEQLGFQRGGMEFCTMSSAFSDVRYGLGGQLWNNRNLLQVSAHVDNLMALISGEQTRLFIGERSEFCIGGDCYTQAHKRSDLEEEHEGSEVDGKESGDGDRRSKRIEDYSREVEILRLRWQLGEQFPVHEHDEQSVSFLGCVMESVRTSLAFSVSQQGSRSNIEWKPVVPDQTIRMSLSEQLLDGLLKTKEEATFDKNLGLQGRALWEAQSHLHGIVRATVHGDVTKKDMLPQQVEVMMLCILGYPSLHMSGTIGSTNNAERNEVQAKLDRSTLLPCCYVGSHTNSEMHKSVYGIKTIIVHTVCGPQKLVVQMNVDYQGKSATLSLFEKDERPSAPVRFRWQDWRDAFTGRVRGQREWQQEHHLGSLSADAGVGTQSFSSEVMRESCVCAIGTEVSAWNGWKPFDTRIALFEAEHSNGLVFQREPVRVGVRHFSVPKHFGKQSFVEGVDVKELQQVSYEKAGADARREAGERLAALLIEEEGSERKQDEELGQRGSSETGNAVSEVSKSGGVAEQEGEGDKVMIETGSWSKANEDELRKCVANGRMAIRTGELLFVKAKCLMQGVDGLRMVKSTDGGRRMAEAVRLLRMSVLYGRHSKAAQLLIDVTVENWNNVDGRQAVPTAAELGGILHDMYYDARKPRQFSARAKNGGEAERNEVGEDTAITAMHMEGDVSKQASAGFIAGLSELLAVTVPEASVMDTAAEILWWHSAENERRARCLFEESIIRYASPKAMVESTLLATAMSPPNMWAFSVRVAERYIAANPTWSHGYVRLASMLSRKAAGPYGGNSLAASILEQGLKRLQAPEGRLLHNLGMLRQRGADGVEKDVGRAVQLYKRASEECGNTYAMNSLAMLVEKGADGVEKDVGRAVQLYQRAIEVDGNTGAMNNLGLLLQKGADGVEKDMDRAVQLYERAIEEGSDTVAMNSLAMLLQKGVDGVEKDVGRAVQLYERAVEEGANAGAMDNLGLLMENGADGVEKDTGRAAKLYERAIQEGRNTYAMNNLAMLVQKGAEGVEMDAGRAVQLYERAIEEGRNIYAMNNLAMLVQKGADGVEKDAGQAMQLYESAIDEGGNTVAMNSLAMMLQKGVDGVEKDMGRAVQLYERAIEEGGNTYAMNNLAMLVQEGADGVKKDAGRAVQLYDRAIEAGANTGVMNNLGLLLQKGADGVEKDASRAVQLYERAIAEEGSTWAMHNLGLLMENGADGVEKDTGRAAKLYERAIQEGRNTYAMNNLAMLVQKGADGVTKDAGRAVQLYESAIDQSGDTVAMNSLAMLLEKGGDGVEKNAGRALQLYERAIEKGASAWAMHNLGLLVEKGADGVAKDEGRAVQLYKRAVEEGCSTWAMNSLGMLVEKGADGVQRDAGRAARLYERAIEEGASTGAMDNLGLLVQKGADGVVKDAVRAVQLFERAIEEGGNTYAMNNLAMLVQAGADGVEKDVDRAVQLYQRAIKEGGSTTAADNLARLLANVADGVKKDAGWAAGTSKHGDE